MKKFLSFIIAIFMATPSFAQLPLNGDTIFDSWNMIIVNASTGRIMYDCTSYETSRTISTVGWPQGIYVVKAWTDDASVNGKFMIENR